MASRPTDLTPKSALIAAAAAMQGRSMASLRKAAPVASSLVSDYLQGKRRSPRLDEYFAKELNIKIDLLRAC